MFLAVLWITTVPSARASPQCAHLPRFPRPQGPIHHVHQANEAVDVVNSLSSIVDYHGTECMSLDPVRPFFHAFPRGPTRHMHQANFAADGANSACMPSAAVDSHHGLPLKAPRNDSSTRTLVRPSVVPRSALQHGAPRTGT